MEKILIQNSENIKSEIMIENELRNRISEFVDISNSFLITNTTVARLYPDFVYKFRSNRVIIIKDGEKYKNFKTCNFILEKLLKEKIERKDTIVALGGGVVGDIVGYVASVILRGVNFIQVPTTLLAMCDSSIGGKTGYNTQFGKNLIGTFYLASKVLIDPLFISTLKKYEYDCGMGEILKYAFIENSCKNKEEFDLFGFMERTQVLDVSYEMPRIISTCAKLKAGVVELDKNEGGLRKILNFGHTFAHSIETLSNYKKISHGQAVAYGIRCANKLALSLNMIDKEYYDRMENLLNKFELGKIKHRFKKSDIVEIMKQDKKVEDGRINLLLPVGQKKVEIFDNIDLPLLEASLL